ncbi:unnamed protein product [Vitrella brassicaformis CCMP3155]|uniref:GPI inositol-deacylase n=4 Tax=Vitrella brassicaformis TaxID=1169539 RepID=A0A0G4EW46_VITBC|nr:unnamed protein product [Vitrella brassicaformis CCMP3155]|eukprot:CEM03149.1 unnamed protein product [Vitrella brassicaformis CCMP3155]
MGDVSGEGVGRMTTMEGQTRQGGPSPVPKEWKTLSDGVYLMHPTRDDPFDAAQDDADVTGDAPLTDQDIDIVFIHGLQGSAAKTWRQIRPSQMSDDDAALTDPSAPLSPTSTGRNGRPRRRRPPPPAIYVTLEDLQREAEMHDDDGDLKQDVGEAADRDAMPASAADTPEDDVELQTDDEDAAEKARRGRRLRFPRFNIRLSPSFARALLRLPSALTKDQTRQKTARRANRNPSSSPLLLDDVQDTTASSSGDESRALAVTEEMRAMISSLEQGMQESDEEDAETDGRPYVPLSGNFLDDPFVPEDNSTLELGSRAQPTESEASSSPPKPRPPPGPPLKRFWSAVTDALRQRQRAGMSPSRRKALVREALKKGIEEEEMRAQQRDVTVRKDPKSQTFVHWPARFIPEDFPGARIIAVDYDAPMFRDRRPRRQLPNPRQSQPANVTAAENSSAQDTSTPSPPTAAPLTTLTASPPWAVHQGSQRSARAKGLAHIRPPSPPLSFRPPPPQKTPVLDLRGPAMRFGGWRNPLRDRTNATQDAQPVKERRGHRRQSAEADRLTLNQLSDDLLARLQAAGVGRNGRGVVLVGHSLGGLLAKSLVVKDKGLRESVRGVLFYGVPHLGAPIASMPRVFRPMFSQIVQQLRPNRELLFLNNAFRDIALQQGIETISVAESRPTRLPFNQLDFVVPVNYAYPRVGELCVVGEADHIEVCKAAAKDGDARYETLRDLITRALEPQESSRDRLLLPLVFTSRADRSTNNRPTAAQPLEATDTTSSSVSGESSEDSEREAGRLEALRRRLFRMRRGDGDGDEGEDEDSGARDDRPASRPLVLR